MPHISVEYSANLDSEVDLPALCDRLRRAGIETGVFPMPGIRVRLLRCDTWSIADGDPKHAFVDISVRLRGGRDLETRVRACADVFDAAHEFFKPLLARRSLALSLEMRDIDPELSPKISSTRDYLAQDAAESA